MNYQGIDWSSLAEAVLFVAAMGVVGLLVAGVVGLWYAARVRRKMWEDYERRRDEAMNNPVPPPTVSGVIPQHIEPSKPWPKQ